MAEESTTPDPVELERRFIEAANGRDVVVRLDLYWHRDRALADLGLEE